MTERSGNEIETLVLKAARGGGMPLGAAEDLAALVPFLDLEALRRCPCHGPDPLAIFGPVALDYVAAGEGPIDLMGDLAAIRALVASYEVRLGQRLIWREVPGGAVFERFEAGPVAHEVRGRRVVPEALLAHLTDLVAKTMVPETEASRLAGAGAGLTDND